MRIIVTVVGILTLLFGLDLLTISHLRGQFGNQSTQEVILPYAVIITGFLILFYRVFRMKKKPED